MRRRSSRRVVGAAVVAIGAAGGWLWGPSLMRARPVANVTPPDLPVPPVPPRIADSSRYDQCMTMLINDPEGAEALAASWQASGGGEAATHCQALAKIASGDAETGAMLLENLAHDGKVQGAAQAVLLSQAAQARLMVNEAALALRDASEALAISPGDPDLLIGRADANDALGDVGAALDDLDQALRVDASRVDALVRRATLWRRIDKLKAARTDIARALALNPDDPEALLERGILRQRAGDVEGARADWIRARDVDPNGEAAELASQNLMLLAAGPRR
jgi:Flp pilus assembly protein TadD